MSRLKSFFSYLLYRFLRFLPTSIVEDSLFRLMQWKPNFFLEAVGPVLNRKLDLDSTSFDLPCSGKTGFEHLSGLFSSNSLNHGVIYMTIRQGAYLFGLMQQLRVKKAIEIGRYKGGATFLMAAAMKGGELWSIDVGEKEQSLHGDASHRPFDEQLQVLCDRYQFKVHILKGDSRTIDIETGQVDLVLIDGDHSYEGTKNDFERFGKRVRIGGAVLFDDVFSEDLFKVGIKSVSRVVHEVLAEGDFRLVRQVDRFAHLERIR